MSRVAEPRWATDYRNVVPSKPKPTIKKKDTKHPPAKPEKIQEMLNDPVKRQHLGPCCVSNDGMLRGTKKWGDGGGSMVDGVKVYVCMGCRQVLEEKVRLGSFWPGYAACVDLARHSPDMRLSVLVDSLLPPRRSWCRKLSCMGSEERAAGVPHPVRCWLVYCEIAPVQQPQHPTNTRLRDSWSSPRPASRLAWPRESLVTYARAMCCGLRPRPVNRF